MLLQRLVADDKSGFNYDFMGAAEYENGATMNGRTQIAELFLRDKMQARVIDFIEVIGRNEQSLVSVLAMGTPAFLDQLGNPAKISVWKETFRTSDKNIIGWLNVAWPGRSLDPFMMVRMSEGADIQQRIEKFLKDPIEYLRQQEAEAAAKTKAA